MLRITADGPFSTVSLSFTNLVSDTALAVFNHLRSFCFMGQLRELDVAASARRETKCLKRRYRCFVTVKTKPSTDCRNRESRVCRNLM